jgi:hypothetical protein
VEVVFVSVKAAALGFFIALWLASAIWTVRDAARRCGDPKLRIGSAAAAVFLPFLGAGMYVLMRPCEERLEVKARRLRIRMLEAALAPPTDRCPACEAPLEPDFRCCPGCGEHVQSECEGCGGLLRTGWAACPWCMKPVTAVESRLPQVA